MLRNIACLSLIIYLASISSIFSQAGSPVLWVDEVNVLFDGTCQKKTNATNWNAGAASAQTIPPGASGWFECQIPRNNRNVQFGVSAFNTNAHFNTIGTALYFRQNGDVRLYKGGVFQAILGLYAVNDRFRIERVFDSLFVYQNGNFLHSLQTNPTELLMADLAIFHQSAQICDVRFYVDSSTIPAAPVDADSDPTNELITDLRLDGTVLRVIEGADTTFLDLANLQDGTTDADADPTNELMTDLGLDGTVLRVIEGSDTTLLDLAILQDGTTDADADPTNELDAIFTNQSGLISNENGDYANDDFVFGSPDIDLGGAASNQRKMSFRKSKGAFRAGVVWADQWSDDSTGVGSFAVGLNTIAIGSYSSALGSYSQSRSSASFAFGGSTIAKGAYSVAGGLRSMATGQNAVAIGSDVKANGAFSIALGITAQSDGVASMAIGYGVQAESAREMVLGAYDTDYVPIGGTNIFNNADRILTVGNGTSDVNRSDALLIFKNGDAVIGGTVSQSSDMRLKKDVDALENVLPKLAKLDAISYNFNDKLPRSDQRQIGLKAQQVQKHFPELVREDGSGYLTVAYGNFSAVLLAAIQEQQVQISEKDERLRHVERQNAEIMESLADLHRMLAEQKNQLNNCCQASTEQSKSITTQLPEQNGQAFLGQNIPNPAKGKTEIPYFISDDLFRANGSRATIQITDIKGVIIKQIVIDEAGSGSITADLATNVSGSYTFSLFAGDQLIDSRVMVLE